jgi:hypothetical protein
MLLLPSMRRAMATPAFRAAATRVTATGRVAGIQSNHLVRRSMSTMDTMSSGTPA